MLCEKLVNNFRKQLVGDESGVFVVCDDESGYAFCSTVGVESVRFRTTNIGLADDQKKISSMIDLCEKGYLPDGDVLVHCSSISCRCPGLVRSATVFEKSDMNSPTLKAHILLQISPFSSHREEETISRHIFNQPPLPGSLTNNRPY